MANTYNADLSNNNASLQAILSTINNLPEHEEVEIVLQSKTVSPSTTAQTIIPDEGYTGLNSVVVNAAPTQSKTITPSASTQTVSPDSGYYGLSNVVVNAAPTQSKTITPGADAQTVSPDSGYYGLSNVVVNGDTNLKASNIKNGVNIFGVTGTNKERVLNYVAFEEDTTDLLIALTGTTGSGTGKYLSVKFPDNVDVNSVIALFFRARSYSTEETMYLTYDVEDRKIYFIVESKGGLTSANFNIRSAYNSFVSTNTSFVSYYDGSMDDLQHLSGFYIYETEE